MTYTVEVPPADERWDEVDANLYYLDFERWLNQNIKGEFRPNHEEKLRGPASYSFKIEADANYFSAAIEADAISQWPEGMHPASRIELDAVKGS